MMDREPSNHRHRSSRHHSSSKSHSHSSSHSPGRSHHKSSSSGHKKHHHSSSSSRHRDRPLKTPEDERPGVGNLKSEGLDDEEEWKPQSLNLKSSLNNGSNNRDRYGSHPDQDHYGTESSDDDDDNDDSFDCNGDTFDCNGGGSGNFSGSGSGNMRDAFQNSKAELHFDHGGDHLLDEGQRKCNMFESFRNLEEAMEIARLESLNTANNGNGNGVAEGAGGGGKDPQANMVQSFRNLELAMAEAQRQSLVSQNSKKKKSKKHGDKHGKSSSSSRSAGKKKTNLFESFTNLDDATAQAIKLSLSDKGKGLFESFCNLDGATERAVQNSMNSTDNLDFENQSLGFDPRAAGKNKKNSVVASFSDLDDAMAQAVKLSLRDSRGDGSDDSDYSEDHLQQILERLDEGGEDDGSFEGGSFRESTSSSLGGGYSGCGSGNGSGNLDDNDVAERAAQQLNRSVQDTTRNMLDFKERRRSSAFSDLDDENKEGGKPGVENVAEPAPNLSRLARRHANRRFNNHQREATSFGDNLDSSSSARSDSGGGAAEQRSVSESIIGNSNHSNNSARRAPRLGLARQEGSRAPCTPGEGESTRTARRHSSLSSSIGDSNHSNNSARSNHSNNSARRTARLGLTRQEGARAPCAGEGESTRTASVVAQRRHSSLSRIDVQNLGTEEAAAGGGGGRSSRRGSRRNSGMNTRSASEISIGSSGHTNGDNNMDMVGPLMEAPVRDARLTLHYGGRQESISAGAMAFEQTAAAQKKSKSKKKSKDKEKKKERVRSMLHI